MESSWPGNVRQLENVIEHAVVVANELEIQTKDFPRYFDNQETEKSFSQAHQSLEELEKEHITSVLKANNWNIRKSALVLGINRVTLYNKIKKYKLTKE